MRERKRKTKPTRNRNRRVRIKAETKIPVEAVILTPEPQTFEEFMSIWNTPLPKKYKDLPDGKKEVIETIIELIMNGSTTGEACKRVGYSVTAFWRVRKKYPELQEIVDSVKEINTEIVEDALFRSAVGYDYETTKEVQKGKPKTTEGGKQVLEDVTVTIEKTKHVVQPNTSACMFYLKNRSNGRWRSDQHLIVETNNGGGRGQTIDVTPEQRDAQNRAVLDRLDPDTRRKFVLAMIDDTQDEDRG